MSLTLGSLFDGSGGFPLAGQINGVTPLWASEVEPFPIRVTTKRFPQMKHYGDICSMNGAGIEPVDIITFGSPCQDMSIAGKRNGLDGTKSSLFYQAIRVIKEMRNATHGRYPRYLVWENVPGAFSSNQGEDFRKVLEEIIRVVDPSAQMPSSSKGWARADCIVGHGWSVAYRTFDAQYFGVPQRRRRIYLVADFASERAIDILFEQDGVSGNFAKSHDKWQRIARSFESRIRTAIPVENHPQDSRIIILEDGKTPTLSARMGTGGNNMPLVLTSYAIQGSMIGRNDKNDPRGSGINKDISFTLNTVDRHAVCPVLSWDGRQTAPTLTRKGADGSQRMPDKDNFQTVIDYQFGHPVIRSLTPLECCRLQGFPDFWCTDLDTAEPTQADLSFWRNVFDTYSNMQGKRPKTDSQIIKWLKHPHTNSAEYKMWGNGIALPCAVFVLAGVTLVNERSLL